MRNDSINSHIVKSFQGSAINYKLTTQTSSFCGQLWSVQPQAIRRLVSQPKKNQQCCLCEQRLHQSDQLVRTKANYHFRSSEVFNRGKFMREFDRGWQDNKILDVAHIYQRNHPKNPAFVRSFSFESEFLAFSSHGCVSFSALLNIFSCPFKTQEAKHKISDFISQSWANIKVDQVCTPETGERIRAAKRDETRRLNISFDRFATPTREDRFLSGRM